MAGSGGNLMIFDESSATTASDKTGSSNPILDVTEFDDSKSSSFHGSHSGAGSSIDQRSYRDSADRTADTRDFPITFSGVDAGILVHFFERDLVDLADVGGKTSRDPAIGQPDRLIIQCSDDRQVYRLQEKCRKLHDKVDRDVNRDKLNFTKTQMADVEDLIRQEGNQSKVLFYLEKGQGVVHVVGRTYDDKMQGLHHLKVHLGIIKTTSRHNKKSYADTAKTGLTSHSSQSSKGKLYPDLSSSYNNNRSVHSSSGSQENILDEKLNGDLRFKVYKTSILRLDVDVIVNAANDNLIHGGGVARVIAEAAGYNLEHECRSYIRNKHKMKVCESFISTAGQLPYKGVIHAVGPQWYMYSDKEDCLKDLYKTVWNILVVCDEQRYTSVAMPAISAGIFGVPKQFCADMYVKAVVDYSRRRESRRYLNEFHVVDVDEEILKLVKDSFQRWETDPSTLEPDKSLSAYRKSHPKDKAWSYSYGRGAGGGRRNRQFGPTDDSMNSSHTVTAGAATDISNVTKMCKIEMMANEKISLDIMADVFKVNSLMKVKVYRGSIEKVKTVQAYVSSVDNYGDPVGIVANILKKSGGYKYEYDIKEKSLKHKSYFLNKGDVFVSKAGQLSVKYVLHVYLPRLSTQNDLPLFQKAMSNVLKQAKDHQIQRIAIPMLGTGGIQDKEWLLKKFAEGFVSSLREFCTSHPQHGLQEVHLVNNTLQVFQVLNSAFINAAQTSDAIRNPSMKSRPLPEIPVGQNSDAKWTNRMDTDDGFDDLANRGTPHSHDEHMDEDGYGYSTLDATLSSNTGAQSAHSSINSRHRASFTDYREASNHYNSDDEWEDVMETSTQEMLSGSTRQPESKPTKGNLMILEN